MLKIIKLNIAAVLHTPFQTSSALVYSQKVEQKPTVSTCPNLKLNRFLIA